VPVPGSGPLRRARRVAHSEWYAWWRRAPLAQNTVLWVSFDGVGMCCHPRAIFEAMLADPRYAHFQHVWVVAKGAHDADEAHAVAAHPRVSVALTGSPLHLRALATAKYLVSNAALPAQFTKRSGQVYLNAWHGTPLEDRGYDAPGGWRRAANVVRNFLQADYLLSSGPTMTEELYGRSYRLRNVYPGTILELGSPRTDVQFDPGARDRLTAELARRGVALGGDRLALVAVDRDDAGPDGRFRAIGPLTEHLAALRAGLGPGWTVLVRLPILATRALSDGRALGGALVPNDVPVNLVIAAADLLVDQGSGLLVDYLPLDRPVICLRPDGGAGEGGCLPDQGGKDAPGPVVADPAGLTGAARRVADGGDDFADARRALRGRLCPSGGGGASRAVVDAVFGGSRDPAVERTLEPDGRTRLLLHMGGMRRNGITSSALNLLRAVDHDRVDVTCFFLESSHPERLRSAAEIDPRARILLRSGGFTATKATYVRARAAYTSGSGDPDTLAPAVRALFADEWTRCFGSAEFDRIADFSGYGAMWGLILLAGRAPLHGIWLHNEMLADSQRIVRGRRPLSRRLHAVFSLYRAMDRLISVSPALRDLNRAELAGFAPPDRFVYARNTLDVGRIDALAAAPVAEGDESAAHIMRWLAQRRGRTVFVTAARLSSEKNQERLIRAFAHVHRSHPGTALLILGDGVLRSYLEDLARELDLGGDCLVAGFQPNPFQFLKHCSCFVLSSNHEGQPMVILEALHLGLQVITTRFSSVDSALPPGVGLVVEQDVHALAEGMIQYLDRGLGPVTFDGAAYNAQAVEEFYTALDIPSLRGSQAD
jgi:CDP-glycerol glycerophosphotransferase